MYRASRQEATELAVVFECGRGIVRLWFGSTGCRWAPARLTSTRFRRIQYRVSSYISGRLPLPYDFRLIVINRAAAPFFYGLGAPIPIRFFQRPHRTGISSE